MLRALAVHRVTQALMVAVLASSIDPLDLEYHGLGAAGPAASRPISILSEHDL